MRTKIDPIKISVVTESPPDTKILEAILPPKVKDKIQIIECSCNSSAVSMARSILAVKYNPIALIVSTRTNNEELIAEKKSYFEWSLSRAGGAAYKVFMAVPDTESLLLPAILKGGNYSPLEQEFARYEPKRFITLSNSSKNYQTILQEILDRLDEETLEEIREIPLVKKIIGFINSPSRS